MRIYDDLSFRVNLKIYTIPYALKAKRSTPEGFRDKVYGTRMPRAINVNYR